MNASAPPDRETAAACTDLPASPALRHFTATLLHQEVWRRPGLGPRDRGLATIATLAALGQTGLLPHALKGGVPQGITREEMDETLAHVAFYAGWGNAMEAARVVERVFNGEECS